MLKRLSSLAALAALACAAIVHLPAAAQAVDRDTACGAAATGYKGDGTKVPVTLTAEQAQGLRVGADQHWMWCEAKAPPPPPTDCAAAPVAKRWGPDVAACSAGADAPISHGQSRVWLQQAGPLRGMLVEACADGQRRVVVQTCAPAAECDNQAEVTRDGAVYRYDARAHAARVALGATVRAVADDGRTWPLTCVAGEWVAPASLPADVQTAPPRVQLQGCGSQTFAARVGLQPLSYWRYAGPRVSTDDVVTVATTAGAEASAVCGPNGRLSLR